MLTENKTLQSLNIESNFITSAGMMSILKAMQHNSTLCELRVDNQVGTATPGRGQGCPHPPPRADGVPAVPAVG